jgi:maltokinase
VALSAYRTALADAERSSLFDGRLLPPLQVAQELHELVYAARHLPHWAYAPTATLCSLFADPDVADADSETDDREESPGGSPRLQS